MVTLTLLGLSEGVEVSARHSESMWNGNGNSIVDAEVCAWPKRKYTYISRNKAEHKERFEKSRVNTTINELQEIIKGSCRCRKPCWGKLIDAPISRRLLEHRNDFHKITSRTDRRLFLSKLVVKKDPTSYLFLGLPVCVRFIVGVMGISLNQFYGVINRREMMLPISSQLQRYRNGITREEAVCGWLRDLGDLQDPQPDKPFVILAHRRKIHVYEEYQSYMEKGTVPSVSRSYFLRVWKRRLSSKIVIRKCMRFALCDTCCRIQEQREGGCACAIEVLLLQHLFCAGTMDRGKLGMLRKDEAAHLQLVKAERIAYAKRMREAVASNGDDVLSIAMDGADQGVYGIPYFAQVYRLVVC